MPRPQPPFHRRILPWLFFIVFLALAPSILLYTAGYRYNPKKGQLERNGTLIIDSTPSGGRVWIDDQDTKDTTPVTFQNITPGWHTVRVVRNGYLPWQKTLEVRAEQVTFANQIWLWKNPTPSLVLQGPIKRVASDTAREQLAFVEQIPASTALYYWSPSGVLSPPQLVLGATQDRTLTMHWRDDGRALFLTDAADQTRAWVSTPSLATGTLDLLPPALYSWSGNFLQGFAPHTRIQINPQTGIINKSTLPQGVLAQTDELRLEQATSSEHLITTRFFQTRALELPAGHWMLGEWKKPELLLQDGTHWLSVDPSADQPIADQLVGDDPRWLPGVTTPIALFLNEREAWLWQLGSSPVLLWRQSDPLVQIAWHRSGNNIFIADAHHLFAVELDSRNGRLVTPLATFDQINDFTIINKTIYLAATKDGKQGLWKMDIE